MDTVISRSVVFAMFIQRCMLGITSAVVTGWPSWKRKPSRSVKVQASPSGDVDQLFTICGLGCSALSHANSVSYSISPATTFTQAEPNSGSSICTSVIGATRNTLSAAWAG